MKLSGFENVYLSLKQLVSFVRTIRLPHSVASRRTEGNALHSVGCVSVRSLDAQELTKDLFLVAQEKKNPQKLGGTRISMVGPFCDRVCKGGPV